MLFVLAILSVYITLFFYFHFFEKNFSSNPNQVLKLANLLNHSKHIGIIQIHWNPSSKLIIQDISIDDRARNRIIYSI